MTRDPRSEASKLALTTDAMEKIFPDAANMTESELGRIYDQLRSAQKLATCPYSDRPLTKDTERFITREADGTIKVGAEGSMKWRNLRDGNPHTALSRVFDPIQKLYTLKREAREHEERECVRKEKKSLAEEKRLAEAIARVQVLVDELTRINAVDQIIMTPAAFSDWLIEVAKDYKIADDDLEAYWVMTAASTTTEESATPSTSPSEEEAFLEQASIGVI